MMPSTCLSLQKLFTYQLLQWTRSGMRSRQNCVRCLTPQFPPTKAYCATILHFAVLAKTIRNFSLAKFLKQVVPLRNLYLYII